MFFREEDPPVEIDRVGGIAIDCAMIDPLGGEGVQTWVYAAFGSLAECREVFYAGAVVEPHEIRRRDIVNPAGLNPCSGIETQPGAIDKTWGCAHTEDKWVTSAFHSNTIQHFLNLTNEVREDAAVCLCPVRREVTARPHEVEFEPIDVVFLGEFGEDGQPVGPYAFVGIVHGDVRRPIGVLDAPFGMVSHELRRQEIVETT